MRNWGPDPIEIITAFHPLLTETRRCSTSHDPTVLTVSLHDVVRVGRPAEGRDALARHRVPIGGRGALLVEHAGAGPETRRERTVERDVLGTVLLEGLHLHDVALLVHVSSVVASVDLETNGKEQFLA